MRGDDTFEAGIPESFNVLVKEMRSLGLNVELLNSQVDLEPQRLPDAGGNNDRSAAGQLPRRSRDRTERSPIR